MVIVVPALAHREKRGKSDIASLRSGAPDLANHVSVVMREVADQPVPEDAGGDACANTIQTGRQRCHSRFIRSLADVSLAPGTRA